MCGRRGFALLSSLVCLLLLCAQPTFSDVVLTDAEAAELEETIQVLETESERLSESLERANAESLMLQSELTQSRLNLESAAMQLSALQQQARRQERSLRRLRLAVIGEGILLVIVTAWAVMR